MITLGRVEEVLDEEEQSARRDYTPEQWRLVVRPLLNTVRQALGLDKRSEDDAD